MKNATMLCSTKPIVTVNGMFPGPTLYAVEDDTVLINVVNHVNYNVTIHWQLRTGWADGPAYITQCPITTGQSYIYNFTITGQRGTLLWHAHILWLRSTVHGAIVILPKCCVPYPFPKPDKEVVVVLAEWWKSDTEDVINEAIKSGLAPNVSDAHTINGLPGPVSDCPSQGNYLVTVSPFMDAPIAVDNITATATLNYVGTLTNTPTILTTPPLENATTVATNFVNSLRSLNSKQYPASVPRTVDYNLYFTVGLGLNPCPTCKPGNGSRVVASINNLTFTLPTTALLQAHYFNINGVFTTDFPANPPYVFNYTGTPPSNLQTMNGTKVFRLAYNANVQLVLQGTGIVAPENHPIHLHGFSFYAVGRGPGNYNPMTDPMKFNLVDPIERNTIGVPSGGWVAIRFRADNPGVWFLHCHLEVHTTWGLKMAFLVDNGRGPNQSLLPPPIDLPKC
ncbi:hypothetical protein GOBAR_DD20387 [Gossypium barbadense]|nr:hypothetical protein GOBAR_DD20387 [Gossypium barbadense]